MENNFFKYQHRKYEEEIKNWINGKENAVLLISGVRQCGKSRIINELLTKNNISYFEINFVRDFKEKERILSINNADEMITFFKTNSKTPLKKGESIIFLDEIQEASALITMIKFLKEEGSFRYILSGSLLGIEIKSIKSFPVGSLHEIKMYTMTFFEFLLAVNKNGEEIINNLKECFESLKPIDPLLHDNLIKLFYIYLAIGGMPSVINEYLNSGNLYYIDKVKEDIINQYISDFVKYETKDKRLKIIEIYRNIPSQLMKQNTKFIFTYLNKELKFDRYEDSFLWLKDAGVSIPVFIVNEVKTPLVISKSKNNFKLYNSDVGLFTHYYPIKTLESLILDNINSSVNNGGIFENFVAQELKANNIEPFYFKSSKIGEIDFLIEIDNEIIPLEIKSGKNKTHKALTNLLETEEYNLNKGYILSNDNISLINENNKQIINLPIYLVSLLKKKESSLIIKNNYDFK